MEDDKAEPEDNAQTIKPINRSPPGSQPVLKAPASDITPIVEDYSDLAGEDEEFQLREKVEHFKKRNSRRKGLFHPDDIQRMARPTVSELALDLTPTKRRPLSGQFSHPDPSPITPPPQSAPVLGWHQRSVSQSHPAVSF